MIVYTLYDTDARVRREAETLAATGRYEIHVLALKDQAEPRQYMLDGVTVQQLDVAKYRGGNALNYILSYVQFALHAFWHVSRRAAERRIDVVHVHNMPNFLVLAGLLPMLQGKKVVLDLHDTMPETFASSFTGLRRRIFVPLLTLEERVCCTFADHLICVNEVQRNAVVRRQPRAAAKTLVSMNVPDPARFRPVEPVVRSQADRLKIIYHGTLSGRLTVDLGIRALALVAQTAPEIELHIAGDGDALDSLRELAGELGVANRVTFYGRMKLDQLIPVIRDMDLGIVPLERNPATELMLSVKLMECLSQGIPVIAPRLDAIQHYFTEQMLFFFEPGDVQSLAGALMAARDPAERLRRVRAAGAFLAEYHWETHKSSLLKVYEYPTAMLPAPQSVAGGAALNTEAETADKR